MFSPTDLLSQEDSKNLEILETIVSRLWNKDNHWEEEQQRRTLKSWPDEPLCPTTLASDLQWSRTFRDSIVTLKRFLSIWAYFEPISDDFEPFWANLLCIRSVNLDHCEYATKAAWHTQIILIIIIMCATFLTIHGWIGFWNVQRDPGSSKRISRAR